MSPTLRGPALAALAILIAAPAHAQPADPGQSREQQRCLARMLRDGFTVTRVHARHHARCASRFAAARLEGTAEACVSGDPRGRLERVEGRTARSEARTCTEGEIPDFGYAGASAVNDASGTGARDLAHDLFGDPVDDALVACDPDREACRCQKSALRETGRMLQVLQRTFFDCSRRGLRDGSIASDADLEGCLADPGVPRGVAADSRGRIERRRAGLLRTLTRRCDDPGVTAAAFGGACEGLAGEALRDCIAERVECRFCQMLNAAGALAVDCDALDDDSANQSCAELSCPVGESVCASACVDLDSDVGHCGACGNACDPGETCSSGLCL